MDKFVNDYNKSWAQSSSEVQQSYENKGLGKEARINRTKAVIKSASRQTDQVIDTICDAIRLKQPLDHYTCGDPFALIGIQMLYYLPECLQDLLIYSFTEIYLKMYQRIYKSVAHFCSPQGSIKRIKT